MPRLSLKTVVLRAIGPAVLDREWMADGYRKSDPRRAKIEEQVERVKALKAPLQKLRKPLALLPEETKLLCFSVLIWAQQYEESLANANHNRGEYAEQAQAAADLFRTTRLAHFGQSALEAGMANSTGVDVYEAMRALDVVPDGEGKVGPLEPSP